MRKSGAVSFPFREIAPFTKIIVFWRISIFFLGSFILLLNYQKHYYEGYRDGDT